MLQTSLCFHRRLTRLRAYLHGPLTNRATNSGRDEQATNG